MVGTPTTARKHRYIDLVNGSTSAQYHRSTSRVTLVTVETKSWRGKILEFCRAKSTTVGVSMRESGREETCSALDFFSRKIVWGITRFRRPRPPGPWKPPPGPSSRRWALHLTLPTPLPRQFVRGLGAPLEQSTEYLLRPKARPRGRCPRSGGQEAATTVDAEAADRAQALGAGPARRAVDAVPVTRGARHRVDPDGLLSSSPTCRRPPARDVRPRDRTARRRAAAVARAGHLLACVADGRRSCKSPAPARACSGPTGARARGDASSLPRHRRASWRKQRRQDAAGRRRAAAGRSRGGR
jgi:hypothetical protein